MLSSPWKYAGILGRMGCLLWVGLNRCRVWLLLMNVILMKQCLTFFSLVLFLYPFGFVCHLHTCSTLFNGLIKALSRCLLIKGTGQEYARHSPVFFLFGLLTLVPSPADFDCGFFLYIYICIHTHTYI